MMVDLMNLTYKSSEVIYGIKRGSTMKIESVQWSNYHLSFEDLIEAWVVAADSVAVIQACIRVRAATPEEIAQYDEKSIE
jgi:hypothetical protein